MRRGTYSIAGAVRGEDRPAGDLLEAVRVAGVVADGEATAVVDLLAVRGDAKGHVDVADAGGGEVVQGVELSNQTDLASEADLQGESERRSSRGRRT